MSLSRGKTLRVEVARDEQGAVILRSPAVGVWRAGPRVGQAVLALGAEGASCGVLSILGVDHALLVPKGVAGRVVTRHEAEVSEPEVDYGCALLTLAPLDGAAAQAGAAAVQEDADGLVFRAPMSGRFYLRPAPDKPAFAEAGAVLARGQTVCLLEVMKTFNRLALTGEDLPERVRVLSVVPEDGADISRGDVLLRLEPA